MSVEIDHVRKSLSLAQNSIIDTLEAISEKSLAHKMLAEDCMHACNTSFAYLNKKINFLSKSLDEFE